MMRNLTESIKKVMYDEGKGSWLSLPLFIFSRVFEGIIRFRLYLYKSGILKSYKLPCQVISIGNITVGGTGKTPFTLYLAEYLRKINKKVVILSRGYGGSLSKQGGVVSDGKSILMTSTESGDEPCLIAESLKDIPVIIGRDRVKMGKKAISLFHPDVILLDDSFQHLRIKRDIDILLMDTASPFGNGYLTPRGTLREPKDHIKRSDIIVFTRSDKRNQLQFNDSLHKNRFYTDHKPFLRSINSQTDIESDLNSILSEKKVFAVSGIAKNHEFRKTLIKSGAVMSGYIEFPDHYNYTLKDISEIENKARKSGADSIVTTEKDYVKFDKSYEWKSELVVIGISIEFESGENHFFHLINEILNFNQLGHE